MASITPRVKGTRDYYPEDWAYIRRLEHSWLDVGRSFGYQEWEGPLLEHMDLYLGKSSEEIVNEQTFRLTDRDGRELVLRPELTPSLARMVAAREGGLVFPARWQSWGRFFRYEKPQRGRGRSFFQWNVDVLGSENLSADAEVLTIACLCLECLGITPSEAVIHVSDRRALERLLVDEIGANAGQAKKLFTRIDRLDKVGHEQFHRECAELGLTTEQTDRLLSLLDDADLDRTPELRQVLTQAEANGVGAYLRPDLKIVRGFDYYTGVVFEAWATTGLRRALFGGGRYDNLTLQVGGKRRIPGVGFAAGDMAITELLKETGKLPELTAAPAQVLVTVFDEQMLPASVELARKLRAEGIRVEAYLEEGHRLDKQFKYADRRGIPLVTVLGPDEEQTGTVVVKDLRTRSQQKVAATAVVEAIRGGQ